MLCPPLQSTAQWYALLMISAAVTQSAAGMDGVQKEALDKFGQALTDFLQSTLDHAQEKQNADPEQ